MIDNCPVRPQIENLKSMKLFFLPSYTTSQTQPRDQGIICSMKSQYHKNVERKVILSVKKKESSPWISLLLGMQMLVAAWDAVTTKSVSQKAARAEDGDPFKKLKKEIERIYVPFNRILFERTWMQLPLSNP